MANSGGISKGTVKYTETFAADNISTASADGIAWLVSSDSGDTAFARAVAAARGLHVAGATSVDDNNLIEFSGDLLQFYGQTGHSAIEVMIQTDDITNCAFNFGFNDDQLEDSTTLPVELSGTTFTANAATFVGLVYDVDADNDDLHCFWVDDSTATTTAIATLRMRGIAPTNSQWLKLRVDIQDRGSGNSISATFLAVDHNGRSAEKTFNTTVDRDAGLCFYFGFENRSGSAHNVYLKMPSWEQGDN